MPVRLRKLIGMIALVTLVIVYALVAMAIAANHLVDSSTLVQLLFFGVSGLFWIVPAMFIIKRMVKMRTEDM